MYTFYRQDNVGILVKKKYLVGTFQNNFEEQKQFGDMDEHF